VHDLDPAVGRVLIAAAAAAALGHTRVRSTLKDYMDWNGAEIPAAARSVRT
jgi:hypothetical protein